MSESIIDQIKNLLLRKSQKSPPFGSGSISFDDSGKIGRSEVKITDDGMRYANPDGPKIVDLLEKASDELKTSVPVTEEGPLENGYYWILRQNMIMTSKFLDIGRIDVSSNGDIWVTYFDINGQFKVGEIDKEFPSLTREDIKQKINLPKNLIESFETVWSY